MYALIKKDLIASRWFLLPGLLVFLLHSVAVFQNTLVYLMFGIAGTLTLILAPLFVDEKYDTEGLSYWLPRRRRTIVQARYLASLIWLLVGLGLVCGLGALCGLYYPDTNFQVITSVSGLATFLLLPALLLTLFFPCYFCLGLARGALVFLGLGFLLAIIVVGPLLAGFLRGSGTSFLTPAQAAAPELGLAAFVEHLIETIGFWPFVLGTGLGMIGLVVLSMYVSICFLRTREI